MSAYCHDGVDGVELWPLELSYGPESHLVRCKDMSEVEVKANSVEIDPKRSGSELTQSPRQRAAATIKARRDRALWRAESAHTLSASALPLSESIAG